MSRIMKSFVDEGKFSGKMKTVLESLIHSVQS